MVAHGRAAREPGCQGWKRFTCPTCPTSHLEVGREKASDINDVHHLSHLSYLAAYACAREGGSQPPNGPALAEWDAAGSLSGFPHFR